MQVNLKAEALAGSSHFDASTIKKISDDVSSRWHQLITAADDRHKLFNNALSFYKTAEQVCSHLFCVKLFLFLHSSWDMASQHMLCDYVRICVRPTRYIIV